MRKYMYITMCVIYDGFRGPRTIDMTKENSARLNYEPPSAPSTASPRGRGLPRLPMIANRQRDIRREKWTNGDRLFKKSPTWRNPTQSNRILVLNPSSLRLFIHICVRIHIYCIFLFLCLLILTSSRLLFDCLLYNLRLLYPRTPALLHLRSSRVPMDDRKPPISTHYLVKRFWSLDGVHDSVKTSARDWASLLCRFLLQKTLLYQLCIRGASLP